VSAGISFVGAGPGAPDLITLRGARRISEADVVLWTPSIIDAGWVRENTRADAELIDLARCADDEIVEIYRRAVRDKLKVVRMYAGDPATWAALRSQLDICGRLGLETEVVAGVSPLSAAAVSVGAALIEPDYADSVITAGQETTGMPDLAQITQFAQFGTTMAVLVPAARAGELADALRAGGYDESTPVVAAYKVSWPDEIVVRTTISELVATVKQHRLWRHTLFLVGGALRAGRARGVAAVPGESPRRSETTNRWSRTRSSTRSSWRSGTDARSTAPEETPAPERVSVSVPTESPKKAAAASSPTKSVTAQAKTPAKAPARKAPAKTAAKAAAAKTTAKQPTKSTQAKQPAKGAKTPARTQPQRGRRA
jgi:precorrin-4/cobalt-precorrin-4 C11-methyltransferase